MLNASKDAHITLNVCAH